MREMKVICSKFNEQANRIEIVREITLDNGTVEYNCLSLPTNRLEWISAEYGIENIDELVEVAIYESLMEPDDVHADEESARTQKRARLAAIKTRLGPMRPRNGVANQKIRLQDAGIPESFVTAVDDDAIEVIKRHSNIDPIKVAEKRDLIKTKRDGTNFTGYIPTPKSSGKSRSTTSKKNENKLPTVKLSKGKRI